MIEVRNLSKQFVVHKKAPGLAGSVKALFWRETVVKDAVKSVSLDIQEGEIVGLIGANGAGKTTLVKMLSGIIYPTSGGAKVLGFTPWERKDEFRRQIALVMGQKAQLWWDLPAEDCFLLLKEIYQIDDKRYRDNIDYLATLLDVKQELNIQIRRLSLGERMKMELMATLLHSPRVVYLDEPTIGLDVTAQRSIREFLLRYRAEHKPAMILTSHYMEDIERLCERVVIIRDGEFVYDGSLKSVVSTYAKYKVITARMKDGAPPVPESELGRLGEVVENAGGVIKLHVPRSAVAATAGALLAGGNVHDLSIEEVDISTIVAEIFRLQKSHSAQAAV